MLTPQEIQERSGSLEKAVFGGYSMSSVEELLEPLQKDYAALYKENAVLKSKMKVLVDRLEEYRKQEESLNRAILTAQKTADDMVTETERKCARMTAEAEQRLRQRSEDLQREIAAETEKAAGAKAELQRKLQLEAQQVERERALLQEKLEAETRRVAMAKKAAAEFIVELEDRVQQQLSQLEGIKQMELVEEPQPDLEPEPEPEPEPQPEPDPEPEAVAEPAAPEQETTEVGDLLGDAPAKPLSESEMSKQIEESLSRILAESMKQDTQPATPSMGDTRVISPV